MTIIRFTIFYTGIFLLIFSPLKAQEVYPLWTDAVPHTVENSEKNGPSLTVFLPDQEIATETGVVICPGGGYNHLAMEKEGYKVAQRLNRMGVAAFVLRYRHGAQYHHPVPLMDAQRAIRTVRHNADKWNIDPHKIGIMGFSAGGHLASTAGTHFGNGKPEAVDEIERVSSRPDFMVLIYPVISMIEKFTHEGSRFYLLGKDPDLSLLKFLSGEKQISADTPPTFLVHGTDDKVVPVENSLGFYNGLKNAGIPVEIHVFGHGPHGFGLAENNPLLSVWPELLEAWMRQRGLLN